MLRQSRAISGGGAHEADGASDEPTPREAAAVASCGLGNGVQFGQSGCWGPWDKRAGGQTEAKTVLPLHLKVDNS